MKTAAALVLGFFAWLAVVDVGLLAIARHALYEWTWRMVIGVILLHAGISMTVACVIFERRFTLRSLLACMMLLAIGLALLVR
jgi:hypothetical protein